MANLDLIEFSQILYEVFGKDTFLEEELTKGFWETLCIRCNDFFKENDRINLDRIQSPDMKEWLITPKAVQDEDNQARYDGMELRLDPALDDELERYINDQYSGRHYSDSFSRGDSYTPRMSETLPSYEEKWSGKCYDSESMASATPYPSESESDLISDDFDIDDDFDDDFFDDIEDTFSEHLLGLLKGREERDSEIYKRAGISKQLFSKIISTKDYYPTKSTAIQLAIGLQLDLDQTQKLLESAGYVLTRSSKADIVVKFFIERKHYNVAFINLALSERGLPLLKTGLRA